MATVADIDLKKLLDTATFLNNRLKIGNDTAHISEEINTNNNSIELKKVELQNIKDATETYNREFIERENNMPAKKAFTNIQDWSLFILFSGYIAFSLGILIYIFRFSRMPILVSIIFMILASILMILFIFMIQRYG
jgi:hypothetical protein